MSRHRDDDGRLVVLDLERDGSPLAVARDVLAASAAEEERFLARLEQMEARPAGQHRRRALVLAAAASVLFACGAVAAMGVTRALERRSGDAGTVVTAGEPDRSEQVPVVAPPTAPAADGAPPPAPQQSPHEGPREPLRLEAGHGGTDDYEEPRFRPGADSKPDALDVQGGAEYTAPAFTIPEDARLLAAIGLQRGSGMPAGQRLVGLEDFLARFPDSAYVAEVRALRVEALAEAGRPVEALAAAERFLDLHPDDPRRPQVRWLEATVARDRLQDCGRALPAYAELAAAAGPFQADAARYVEVCTP